MAIAQLITHQQSSQQSFAVWNLLGFYLFAVSGLPVPLAEASSSLVVRYPCEDSQCGCQNAAACWKSCCCHTLAEKLAWARRNGVAPPAAVLQQLATHNERVSKPTSACGEGCCDSAGNSDVPIRTCCSRPVSSDRQAEDQHVARGVTLLAATGCGGNLFGLPGIVPGVSAPVGFEIRADADSETVSVNETFTYCELSYPPRQPPPQDVRFVAV